MLLSLISISLALFGDANIGLLNIIYNSIIKIISFFFNTCSIIMFISQFPYQLIFWHILQ